MKTLVLSDAAYERLLEVDPAVAQALTSQAPALPEAIELHRMARAGETPELFDLARSRLEATSDAHSDMREVMHELIFRAYELGVQQYVLARWTGYSKQRIAQILSGESNT